MSDDVAYPVGQRCWFPHDVEGFVSGDLVTRQVEGQNVTLTFQDEVDRVRTTRKVLKIVLILNRNILLPRRLKT